MLIFFLPFHSFSFLFYVSNKGSHITPVLYSLCCFPVDQNSLQRSCAHIQSFKWPGHRCQLLTKYSAAHSLRSKTLNPLVVPRTLLKTIKETWAIQSVAPRLGSSLPLELCFCDSVAVWKKATENTYFPRLLCYYFIVLFYNCFIVLYFS